MDCLDLFEAAHGLQDPWEVVSVDPDPAGHVPPFGS
jgi:hypothetical protein